MINGQEEGTTRIVRPLLKKTIIRESKVADKGSELAVQSFILSFQSLLLLNKPVSISPGDNTD